MSGTVQGKPRPLAIASGHAELCIHGRSHGHPREWRTRNVVLRRDAYVTAERNGPDVLADERVPFGAVAQTRL